MMQKAFLEFMEEIEIARNQLKCSKTGAFYRGHTKISHSLVPSLLRTRYTYVEEHNFYVDSYARGRDFIKNSTNSWEFLSIMQHFGIPTRLLDWSESLATALFFALSAKNPEPQIWIVNPFLLNASNTTNSKRIFTIGMDQNIPDYENCFVSIDNKQDWPFKDPIFLQIPWANERMKNQKGFFTVHVDETPMEVSCEENVRKVVINEEAIPGVKRFLEYAGINDDTIFPDLDGFGRFLRKKYLA